MDPLTIFVYYDRIWNEKNDYVDFKVVGLLLTIDCSYSNLLQMFPAKLNRIICKETCNIQCLVNEGYKPVKINNNHQLLFYIELKKKDINITSFPLCITTEDNLGSANIDEGSITIKQRDEKTCIDLQDVMELSNLENASSNLDKTTKFQDFIDTAKRVVDSIVNCKEIEENNNELVDSIVITNPRNQEVAASQVYKDKSLLKNVMSFYAISFNF